MRTSRGPSKETKELIAARAKELREDKQNQEKKFIRGRWVTDDSALKNNEILRKEQLQRKAPKALARFNVYNKWENENTGLELDQGEVADRVTQADIYDSVDIRTQEKKYDLILDKLGPYKIDFSRNGSHLLLAGLRGHLSNIRWKNFSLQGEAQLKDKINDAIFLVDHTMTAVAQKKYVYLYTKEGVEMHILSKMMNMNHLGYLHRHLLLVAASSMYSTLNYIDVSTGVTTGLKEPSIVRNPIATLAVNPANGVVGTSDVRGVVKFWSPTVTDPLIQIKGHKSVIYNMRFHPNGRFFVTVGGDHKVKIWDTRTLRTLNEYAMNYSVSTLDISQTGLIALGGGTHVQIGRNMFHADKSNTAYMKFPLGYGNVAECVRFCPFEDVLGVGHSRGFQSLLIPSSGEANPDYYDANPYETERHRKDRVVNILLDKLPPDTISMDVQIPGVNEERLAEYNENIRHNRKARAIRERKERKANNAQAGTEEEKRNNVTGLTVGDDEEVDEELGFKEKPLTRVLKSKKERQAEKKKEKWDRKDSVDKVRSKQTMRNSRIVQRQRAANRRDTIHGEFDKDALSEDEAEALEEEEKKRKAERKKRAREHDDAVEDIRSFMANDSLLDSRSRRQSKSKRGDESLSMSEVKSNMNAALQRLM